MDTVTDAHVRARDIVAEYQHDPSKALREALATLAHEQWSGWMDYLFQFISVDINGRWVLDRQKAERWNRQRRTPYIELSEREKESDRIEADKVLALMAAME